MRKKWLIGFIGLALVSTGIVWAQEPLKPLTLEESVKIALERSLTLHSALEGIMGSEFRRKETMTNFLPTWTGQYSYTRWSYPSFVGNLGGGVTGLSTQSSPNVYNFNTTVI